ncbi:MAG: PAS domain S-box protein [Bacteroidia bacterium]
MSTNIFNKPPDIITRRLPYILAFFTAIIFYIDIITPLGIAIPFGYVFVVLAGYFAKGYKTTFIFSGLCIALIIAGYFLSPPNIDAYTAALSNRAITICSVILASVFTIRFKKFMRKHKANESLLQSILSSANESIIVINEAGEIVYNNSSASKKFGFLENELKGKKAEMLVKEGQDTEIEQLSRIFLKKPDIQDSLGIDLLAKRKDGTAFPVNVSLGHFTSKDGDFTTCFIMDISARKAAEAEIKRKNDALKKSENFLQSIIHNLPLDISVQNAKTHEIVLENNKKQNPPGIKPCLLSAPAAIDINYAQAKILNDANEKALKTGKTVIISQLPIKINNDVEKIFRIIKAPILEPAGEGLYIINICEDITESILALREIETTNQLLQESQEIGNVGSFEGDLVKSTLTVSKEMIKILGFVPAKHYNPKTSMEHIHPDDKEKILKQLNQAIENHSVFDLEYRIIRPDNEIRYVWSKAKVFYNENNEPVYLRGLVTDITEIKNAEKEREEYINSLSEMLFMTSHKVRVPIANILGFSEVLEQFLNQPEKLEKSVAFIKKSAHELDLFTRELTIYMEQLKANKET